MCYNKVVNKVIQSELSQSPSAATGALIRDEVHPALSAQSNNARLVFVEVFAGSAKLSSRAHRRGFHTISIDHSRNPHKAHHPLLLMDLTDGGAQQQFFSMFHDDPPAAMAFAPPCGTCSRARERELVDMPDAPKPLGDADHPFGYPWLQGVSLTRVLQSNILYSFVVDALFFAFTHSIVISVENPLYSWLWTILKHLVVQHPSVEFRRWFNNLEAVKFSNCAWGGNRPKMTKCPSVYTMLAKQCPGNHYHKPYVAVRTQDRSIKFSTAEEAEYPWGLCDKVVELAAKHFKYPQQMALPRDKVLAMASSHREHRAHPPLIPEFHSFQTSKVAPDKPHKINAQFPGVVSGATTILATMKIWTS